MSEDSDRQASFDSFSSKDLITWKHHPHVLDFADVPWSTNRAVWAPTVAEKNGKYYMYFPAGEWVGIGVAVTDLPAGPSKDTLGRPLVEGRLFGTHDIDATDPLQSFQDNSYAGEAPWTLRQQETKEDPPGER